MRKRETSRRGIAAVEFAIMLPAMVMILLLLVEGGNAMHAYSSLTEASREGARLALMDGGSSDIQALVESVVSELDTNFLTTSVTTDAGTNTVTVEVSYAYVPFGEDAFELLTGDKSFPMVAQTVMPLP
ncbi:TadE/TadG family type IV pilus assembly protein [Pseudodesulfovibrio sp. zrk46]|uniref:TadE/TadG family type IV pilus assembly protein n=1 Tax=Pseudodesulfovibrio sp. zrk46 TaxID=2725288 RepID=UPI001449C23E|nr:TadE/TadG family type IV pilus assembly protein [Pseudodesulfovibrio sp. zrk46]QJB55230.1 pilus assembly protein [Pseudodesulfovibrio sp. zrk46]